MNILISPDSFKGSISAIDICEVLTAELSGKIPDAVIKSIPIADGGEGTIDSIISCTDYEKISFLSVDALGNQINSFYAINSEHSAIIEMAAASGLELIREDRRNLSATSTYGTGLLIKAAIDDGATKIYVTLGGSATNDAGAGMASALGYRFLDRNGEELSICSGNLSEIESIDDSNVDVRLKTIEIIVAVDVQNPLFGENGASFVYGPQKGGTQNELIELDKGIRHFASTIRRDMDVDVSEFPGGGAAGGIGAGLVAFCQAKVIKGFDLVNQLTGLEKHIMTSDFVITGEGRIDSQTMNGKAVLRIAELCHQHNKIMIMVAGEANENILNKLDPVHHVILSKISGDSSLSVRNPITYLEKAAEQISNHLINNQF